ncbi:MAG: hypothetical protein J6M18_04975 [Actinomycetaceae bacterium]|nr:hypothetical protein [Actinomycetaceae bacterium]
MADEYAKFFARRLFQQIRIASEKSILQKKNADVWECIDYLDRSSFKVHNGSGWYSPFSKVTLPIHKECSSQGIESIHIQPYRIELDESSGSLLSWSGEIQMIAVPSDLNLVDENCNVTMSSLRYWPALNAKKTEVPGLTWERCFRRDALSPHFVDFLRGFMRANGIEKSE